ncbi:NUDIX domain-containing protein [Nocardioides sp. KIGAM211]|uniref:NUDIX domain-containing protein n=1 Tax=Nocardioides luti TaxID=2761101 RepID=A0A7X0RF75_9ACTN|nr:NUDIX domain-containing protein [Nocardioides luti]
MSRFVVVPASYVFLLREGDAGTEVLLQRRQNTGYMDDHWAAAAAGHVERGETAYDAAHREALEEIDVSDLDLAFVTSMQRTRHADAIDERVDFFFTARSWSGDPRIVEPEKCAELRWCALTDLPTPVVPHEASVLEAIRSGTTTAYSTFGFTTP